MNFKSILRSAALAALISFSIQAGWAAQTQSKEAPNQVDTVSVKSDKMGRFIKNVVILPMQYFDADLQEEQYPVLYLLHGYDGDYSDWIKKKPELEDMATDYGVIVVCPDGQDSWYIDSPINPAMQFETYVVKELVKYIDDNYRTQPTKEFRAITGLSMGGHGGITLGLKHPDVFMQCGSMSGGLNLTPFPTKWKIKNALGEYEANKELWAQHSAVNIAKALTGTTQRIIFDCGVDDFMYPVNLELHQALLDKKIDHDFISRPGKHSWSYWCNSIDYQMLFFSKGFDIYGEALAK